MSDIPGVDVHPMNGRDGPDLARTAGEIRRCSSAGGTTIARWEAGTAVGDRDQSVTDRPPERPDGDSAIRFERVDDDGRFCVLRVTMAPLSADELVLRVATDSAEQGFLQVDPGFDEDESHADFLLPSRLLAGSAFALDVGGRLLRLPPPTDRAAFKAAPGALIEHAQLAQQEQLTEQARRLAALRDEVREARDREWSAGDELEQARTRFEAALLAQREELQAASARVVSLEAQLAGDAPDEHDEAAELRRELERARSGRARAEERVAELEREANAIDDQREVLASALADAERALDEERAAAAELKARVEAAEQALEKRRRTARRVAAEHNVGPLIPGEQGARIIALNMALRGTPRDETAEYLAANFEIADRETLLDEVYGRADA